MIQKKAFKSVLCRRRGGLSSYTARNVFTPERWSELETIQLGGRVRDQNLCRIFSICLENSERRKPFFYAEAIGAARITRRGAAKGAAIAVPERLQLSHPPIADNLRIYNTPNEVASYIKSREPKLQNKATHYLGVAGMADKLIAWLPELRFVYSLLIRFPRDCFDRESSAHADFG
jgi:hypothetical protein